MQDICKREMIYREKRMRNKRVLSLLSQRAKKSNPENRIAFSCIL